MKRDDKKKRSYDDVIDNSKLNYKYQHKLYLIFDDIQSILITIT